MQERVRSHLFPSTLVILCKNLIPRDAETFETRSSRFASGCSFANFWNWSLSACCPCRERPSTWWRASMAPRVHGRPPDSNLQGRLWAIALWEPSFFLACIILYTTVFLVWQDFMKTLDGCGSTSTFLHGIILTKQNTKKTPEQKQTLEIWHDCATTSATLLDIWLRIRETLTMASDLIHSILKEKLEVLQRKFQRNSILPTHQRLQACPNTNQNTTESGFQETSHHKTAKEDVLSKKVSEHFLRFLRRRLLFWARGFWAHQTLTCPTEGFRRYRFQVTGFCCTRPPRAKMLKQDNILNTHLHKVANNGFRRWDFKERLFQQYPQVARTGLRDRRFHEVPQIYRPSKDKLCKALWVLERWSRVKSRRFPRALGLGLLRKNMTWTCLRPGVPRYQTEAFQA